MYRDQESGESSRRDDSSGRGASTSGETVVEFSPPGDSVTHAVTEAVVRRSGRDPLTLPPLQTVVDCDALDMLFGCRHPSRESVPEGLVIVFDYVGYSVTVGEDRVVVDED